jgi:transposase
MAVKRMHSSQLSNEALARELGVTPRCLYKWQAKWRNRLDRAEAAEAADSPGGREAALRQEVAELKQRLADKALEIDFFKGALHKIEARRRRSGKAGERASTSKSAK